ncbi:MAG: FeoA family protein [Propionibacteriaceae bacterium]
MSLLSTALQGRVIAPNHHAGGRPSSSLADLAPGRSARIIDVSDEVDPATARRLVDLGFAPGAEVLVVRRAPLADPVVFRVAGFEMALRRKQARCIRVCLDA